MEFSCPKLQIEKISGPARKHIQRLRARSAKELMTRGVITVREEMPVASALTLSAEKRVKRLPVVDADGELVDRLDPADPVVGCVGLVPDVRSVPGRWQSGDAVLLATSPDGSLAAEAALIRFLWKAAPHLSLCHDVGSGGIAAALAEPRPGAAGSRPTSSYPADYDSRRGAAILACRRAASSVWASAASSR